MHFRDKIVEKQHKKAELIRPCKLYYFADNINDFIVYIFNGTKLSVFTAFNYSPTFIFIISAYIKCGFTAFSEVINICFVNVLLMLVIIITLGKKLL